LLESMQIIYSDRMVTYRAAQRWLTTSWVVCLRHYILLSSPLSTMTEVCLV
jgi:hypothetical protein